MSERSAGAVSGAVGRAFGQAMIAFIALGVVVVLLALFAPPIVTAIVAAVAFVVVVVTLLWVRRSVATLHEDVVEAVEPGATVIRSAAEARQRMLDGLTQSTRLMSDSLDALDRRSAELREQAVVIGNRAHTASVNAEGALEASASVEVAMTTLRRGIETMHGLVARLSDHASEIEKVSVTVDQIASRTNMLALNAAVEAARAGEEGKGFAVIAREIRGLARQSKSEATHITSLVSEIQRLTNTMVMSADERLQQFGRVGGSIDTVMTAFHSVEASIEEMADVAEQMTASARDQDTSSGELRERLGALSEAAVQSKSHLTPVYQALETLRTAIDELKVV